jgi:hypothetical protein
MFDWTTASKETPMVRSRTHSSRYRAVSVGATVGLTFAALLTACGGGSDSSTSTPATQGAVATSAVDGTTASNAGTTPEDTSAVTLPTGQGAPEEFGLSLAELTKRIEETERLIGTCMASDGFQYIAVDFASVKKAMDAGRSVPGLSDEDYVKQFGLGITTQFDNPLVSFGAGPENTTYLKGLPATDQVAFRRALWGEAPDWNHARAIEEEDFSQTGGCTRSAAAQVYKPNELTGTYVNPADKLVEQDPRMIAALKKFGECMREEGYEFDHPDQVSDDLVDRLAVISEGRDPRTLTGSALEKLKALQGEELAVADVLLGCEEDIIEPVQQKVEQEIYGTQPS